MEAVLGPDEGTATAVAAGCDGLFEDGDATRVVHISELSIAGDWLVLGMVAEESRALPVYRDD